MAKLEKDQNVFETDSEKMIFGFQPKYIEIINKPSANAIAMQPFISRDKDGNKVFRKEYFVIKMTQETEKGFLA